MTAAEIAQGLGFGDLGLGAEKRRDRHVLNFVLFFLEDRL